MSEERGDSREQIMEATYDALVENGYAALTMSDIAEASGTSTALLHYHYDTKEDLLVAFLEHVISQIESDLSEAVTPDPLDRLKHLIELYVLRPAEDERIAFHTALLELRTQAPHNERYRERFAEADRLLQARLVEIITDLTEAGLIDGPDTESLAVLILATLDGARTRQITVGDPEYSSRVYAAFVDGVLLPLLSDEGVERWHGLAHGGDGS